MLCFVIINGILFNFLFDWILFYNASSYSRFRFVFSPYGMVAPLQLKDWGEGGCRGSGVGAGVLFQFKSHVNKHKAIHCERYTKVSSHPITANMRKN